MKIFHGSLFLTSALLLASCGKKQFSSTTGWTYNEKQNGGFEVVPYIEQETGPGLVFIEGGTFAMGRVEQDVLFEHNNPVRRVTVSSFYMDEAEVTNLAYLEYLHWLQRVFGEDYPEVLRKALPDTLVWRSQLGFNEPYVENYLRHPAYNFYPVVGVTWVQANDFCAWRTDRVNEQILVRERVLNHNPEEQIGEENFNTEAYLVGQYQLGFNDKGQPTNIFTGEARIVRMEDGILLPRYRLPTEAEWEYAALALVGNTDPSTDREIVKQRRLYPWNGHIARNPNDKFKGDFLANFRRGRGDLMGGAGRLNDMADITGPVYKYWPNDFGLYNMPGNVSEWVMDVYRPLSMIDMDEFRPVRGNVFKRKLLDADGMIEAKDTLGRIQYVDVDTNANRRNYSRASYLDVKDGDYTSSIYYDNEGFQDPAKSNELMYEFGATSLINNKARVVKGGSWKDVAYWLVPGTRRFMDEETPADWIGFRCAMDRVGSPIGLGKNTRYQHRGGQQYRKEDKR
jgi:gliding motility-associated lipoprotein GldJ